MKKPLPSCKRYDPDLWFPVSQHSVNEIMVAKAICGECPLQTACITYALDAGIPYGIWGGYTEWERVKMTRRNLDANREGRPGLVKALASA